MKTPKGTQLQVLDLKGKDYLPVAQRLIWFREEHPDWAIETEVKVVANECLAKATIKDHIGRIIATAHKTETKQGFMDFVEKAETGSIGRALGLCGYGTQFTHEFDEGDRIVDAPISPKHDYSSNVVVPKPTQSNAPLLPAQGTLKPVSPDDLGSTIITFGNKYKANRFDDLSLKELEIYRSQMDRLRQENDHEGKTTAPVIRAFLNDSKAYLASFTTKPFNGKSEAEAIDEINSKLSGASKPMTELDIPF